MSKLTLITRFRLYQSDQAEDVGRRNYSDIWLDFCKSTLLARILHKQRFKDGDLMVIGAYDMDRNTLLKTNIYLVNVTTNNYYLLRKFIYNWRTSRYLIV